MDDPSTIVPANLFKDVKYYFIGSIPKSIETILNAGGGKKDQYLSEILTHCIADEDDGEVNEAKELFQLAVVKSSWVIQSAKCGCLLPTSLFDPDSKVNIFSKVVACPSQILAADNKVLWSLVTTHGGEYVTRLDKKVTHLLTSSSTGVKYDLAMKHPDSIHIVTPDWVVDSCTSKQRLVEARYHPRLLQPAPAHITTPTEITPSAMETSTTDQPDKPVEVRSPEPTVSCRLKTPPLSVKKSPKTDSHGTKEALARIVVSRQQTSNLHFKESLNMPEKEMLVPSLKLTLPIPALATRVAKTSISPAVSTPAIVPYSCAPSISTACTAPVTATPAAASTMLPSSATSTIMTVPTQVPIQVPTQVPNKSPSRSTLRNIANGSEPRNQKSSNKANSAKISQLMTNISQMPRQMSPVRPGLVAYPPLPAGKNHVQGDVKLYYGHDPGEHVPEDACLLGCVFYITDYQKQLEPASLDVWKRVISQYGGQVDDSYSNRITHVLCKHQKSDVFQLALQDGKRLVTAHWLNDCLLMKKMSIPWTSLHFPYFFGKERPCANQIICVTNFSGEDRTNIKHMILLLGAKYTGYMTRANSVLIAKWSGGTKLNKAKEWNIPVVNVTWLNDLILGDLNALKLPVHSRYTTFTPDDPFRIDQSRVARLLEGWKVPVKISKETWKKFQSFQMLRPSLGMPGSYYNVPPSRSLFNGGSTAQKRHAESDGDMVEKRMRLDSNRSPMVLITGIPRVTALYLAQEVERLGGCVVNSARSCTHLVSSSILRTVKFLTALNLAKFIVTPDWIEQSAKMNRFLDEGHFPICDEIAESTYNFRFRETLRRTKERKLFEGLAFYITPSVLPGKSILGEIVENAGGRILDSLPPLNEVVKCVNNRGEPTLIVVTCEDDVYICHDLINKNIGIHNAEFILTGVLRQEVDYFSYRLNESTVS